MTPELRSAIELVLCREDTQCQHCKVIRDALSARPEEATRDALRDLLGQVENARDGFGVYRDSPSMAEAIKGARDALGMNKD